MQTIVNICLHALLAEFLQKDVRKILLRRFPFIISIAKIMDQTFGLVKDVLGNFMNLSFSRPKNYHLKVFRGKDDMKMRVNMCLAVYL